MSTSFDLSGRLALVTGASSGLGNRFAQVLANNGARVVLASRRVERLKELRAEIEANAGTAHVIGLDVTDRDAILAAVEKIEADYGPIDILVNNSGVSNQQRLLEVEPEDYDFVMDTNLRGAFFVAQAVGRRMVARAKAAPDPSKMPWQRIINIASMAGIKALPLIGVYSMSKAAAIQMTRAMALEWGRYNINVNAVAPGWIRTELIKHLLDNEAVDAAISRDCVVSATTMLAVVRRKQGEPMQLTHHGLCDLPGKLEMEWL